MGPDYLDIAIDPSGTLLQVIFQPNYGAKMVRQTWVLSQERSKKYGPSTGIKLMPRPRSTPYLMDEYEVSEPFLSSLDEGGWRRDYFWVEFVNEHPAFGVYLDTGIIYLVLGSNVTGENREGNYIWLFKDGHLEEIDEVASEIDFRDKNSEIKDVVLTDAGDVIFVTKLEQ